MAATRRGLLAAGAALGLGFGLARCAPRPATRGDVFAAGQPAALLIVALAPQRLIGWPRRPSEDTLALLPPEVSRLETGALASGGAPASLEAVAALRPRLIIDYGDLDPDYRALGERVEQRLGVPYHLIDGSLAAIPQALETAGGLLDAETRARDLAAAARTMLDQWSAARTAGPSFFYVRGGEGLETGFRGSLATEGMEGAGWTNVAVGGSTDTGRVSREQIAAWDPEVLVTMDEAFAARAAADPFWTGRSGGRRRRILLLPQTPFGWLDRPPSINRLMGCAWLSAPGPEGDRRALAIQTALWGEGAPTDTPRWLT